MICEEMSFLDARKRVRPARIRPGAGMPAISAALTEDAPIENTYRVEIDGLHKLATGQI